MKKPLPSPIVKLLLSIGLRGNFEAEILSGGYNNRVIVVSVDGFRTVVVKEYFWHKEDRRNRLQAEYSFSQHLWDSGVHSIPRPIACDSDNRIGVYEYIEGREFQKEDVDQFSVNLAVDFYKKINSNKDSAVAMKLPLASEACFLFEDHIRTVDKRIENLKKISNENSINKDVIRFVETKLDPTWINISQSIRSNSRRKSIEFIDQNRRLSPSDFGFHNAVYTESRKHKFLDFEYSGWDDPAKTVCDFFCQPKIPVPLKWFDEFSSQIVADLVDPEGQMFRIDLLFDLYRVKWCCILLNDFLTIHSYRRDFSFVDNEQSERKLFQFEKAKQYFKLIDGVS